MRKIRPKEGIEVEVAVVRDVFPDAVVLDPEQAQVILDRPAVSVIQVAESEEERAAQTFDEFDELVKAVGAMRSRRDELAEHFDWKVIGKRTYFVMQCARCDGLFIGTSGAKGWAYPSGRRGSCSVCSAGLTAPESAKIANEAVIIAGPPSDGK